MSLEVLMLHKLRELVDTREQSAISTMVNFFNDGQATSEILFSGVAKISALRSIIKELEKEVQQRQTSDIKLREEMNHG